MLLQLLALVSQIFDLHLQVSFALFVLDELAVVLLNLFQLQQQPLSAVLFGINGFQHFIEHVDSFPGASETSSNQLVFVDSGFQHLLVLLALVQELSDVSGCPVGEHIDCKQLLHGKQLDFLPVEAVEFDE